MSDVKIGSSSIGSVGIYSSTLESLTGRDITGSGVVGQTGAAPDPSTPAYSAVMGAIARMVPTMVGDMVEVLLAEITEKMKDIESKSQESKINVDTEMKRTSLADKREKLEEAEKKIKEAAEERKGPFGWIKAIFMAIASAIAIIAGALLSAIPGFQAVGALLITAGVIGMVMAIDSMVQLGTGSGIMGNLAKAFGASDEVAMGIDMGFKALLAVAGIAVSIAMFFVPGGQANAVANMIQAVSTIANAIVTVGSTAADVSSAVINYKAAEKEAEGRDLQAEAKDMEAMLEVLDQFIDMAISRLVGSMNRFNDMLDAITDSMKDRADSLARVRFS
ncbi:hypothetical protein [Prosthecomicrobium sp. N25]|uniref:hypothetical protein n=1 Tax=Prosthecomicrobium sp. N25 TaxID=3129254 RepID=UPI003076D9AE